jgi:hypothetical protein
MGVHGGLLYPFVLVLVLAPSSRPWSMKRLLIDSMLVLRRPVEITSDSGPSPAVRLESANDS